MSVLWLYCVNINVHLVQLEDLIRGCHHGVLLRHQSSAQQQRSVPAVADVEGGEGDLVRPPVPGGEVVVVSRCEHYVV